MLAVLCVIGALVRFFMHAVSMVSTLEYRKCRDSCAILAAHCMMVYFESRDHERMETATIVKSYTACMHHKWCIHACTIYLTSAV